MLVEGQLQACTDGTADAVLWLTLGLRPGQALGADARPLQKYRRSPGQRVGHRRGLPGIPVRRSTVGQPGGPAIPKSEQRAWASKTGVCASQLPEAVAQVKARRRTLLSGQLRADSRGHASERIRPSETHSERSLPAFLLERFPALRANGRLRP